MREIILTADRLRHALGYNPDTGIFTWVNPGNCRIKKGSRAGSLSKYGYIVIRVDGGLYRAHRLAWLHTHGEWPHLEIDHINGCKTDNRICNLRDVSRAINKQNMRRAKHSINRSSTLLGVHRARYGRWSSEITAFGCRYWLGEFPSEREAHEAYVRAKRVLHPGCSI